MSKLLTFTKDKL